MIPEALTSRAFQGRARIRHGFFGRPGGVSRGLYASLNCGLGSNDERAAVQENRARALGALGGANALLTVHQHHSALVAVAREAWPAEAPPRADAMVTDSPGLALGVLAADCVPVLFADPEAGVIGGAHAGWRGALDGVLEATLEAMERLGAAGPRICAAVGPAIQAASYEIGPEFPAPFLARDPWAAGLFRPKPASDRLTFDLPAYVEGRLERAGVGTVDRLDQDTFAQPDRFFSYRHARARGAEDYGRNLSLICLEA